MWVTLKHLGDVRDCINSNHGSHYGRGFFFFSLMRRRDWDSECVTQHNSEVLVQELIKHWRRPCPTPEPRPHKLLYVWPTCHGDGVWKSKAHFLTANKSPTTQHPIFTLNKKMNFVLFLPATLHSSVNWLT